MSFSGKKFRRVRCENFDQLAKKNEQLAAMMKACAPIFSFTRVGEETFTISIVLEEKSLNYSFKLGQEIEVERQDKQKVKLLYTLEGDDVLKKVVTQPDGSTHTFRLELNEREPKLVLRIPGSTVEAIVHYEIVK